MSYVTKDGRPKVITSVAFPQDVSERLKARGIAIDRSMAQLVREAVAKEIATWEDEEPPKPRRIRRR